MYGLVTFGCENYPVFSYNFEIFYNDTYGMIVFIRINFSRSIILKNYVFLCYDLAN